MAQSTSRESFTVNNAAKDDIITYEHDGHYDINLLLGNDPGSAKFIGFDTQGVQLDAGGKTFSFTNDFDWSNPDFKYLVQMGGKGTFSEANVHINDVPPPHENILVTFDDLPEGGLVPDGYAGFNWDYAQVWSQPIVTADGALYTFDKFGDEDADLEATNSGGGLAGSTFISRVDGSEFDFISFKAIDWYPPVDAERLIINGYNDGQLIHTDEITLSDTTTLFTLSFTGIDQLEIRTDAQDGWLNDGSNRGLFSMDDLLFVV